MTELNSTVVARADSGAWLRATGLAKSYRSRHREVEVLRGVDLEVSVGESVAITGASGSGKSTLLNLLGSLDRPDQGSILWGEIGRAEFRSTQAGIARRAGISLLSAALTLVVVEIAARVISGLADGQRTVSEILAGSVELPVHAIAFLAALVSGLVVASALVSAAEKRRTVLRNRQIGFVFQQHHLLGDFTALENVMMPARVSGFPEAEAAERAKNLLERVGLGSRIQHLPGELSGGEQQRVAVARALMNHPRLLLLDEPGGNLDRARADDLHDLLLRLAREEQVAVVAVTHDESLARRADRWLNLVEGHLVDHGALLEAEVTPRRDEA